VSLNSAKQRIRYYDSGLGRHDTNGTNPVCVASTKVVKASPVIAIVDDMGVLAKNLTNVALRPNKLKCFSLARLYRLV
jgi:hypothetical protein